MSEKQEIFGKIFDSIAILSYDHLDIILKTMDEKTAIYFLTQAVSYAHSKGVYSLGECEVISKSIRVLSKTEEQEKE
jgi:hypothetical protein